MTPHALPYARFGRRNYEVRELSNVDPDANGAEAGKGYLRRGTPELRRANLAFFVAGLAMFAMLYCTQPLLPVFSAEFGVTPAVASLSLSLATGTLAVTLILAGTFSEAWGRAPMMTACLGARLAPDDGS